MSNRTSIRIGSNRRQLSSAVAFVRGRLGGLRPKLAIILGSGFHGLSAEVKLKASISYSDIPGFLETGVKGHSGRLLVGKVSGLPVLILSGRAHFYEGHSLSEITFPVRVMARLGVTELVATNAAGGIDRKFRPGDFMLLKDHLNLMGATPLRPQEGEDWDGNFLDMSAAYDPGLAKMLKRAGRAVGVKMRQGVYAAVSGPNYETPAEVRMLGRLGAHAVGMSTVPEVIVARQCGLHVAGLSLITNAAAGITGEAISHTEVLARGKEAEASAGKLMSKFCQLYAEQ